MNSQAIQEQVYNWALGQDFTAPYGVLTGEHRSRSNKKFLSVTFGRARTLDATVEIYNRNFMVLRTNRFGSEVYKNVQDLMAALKQL